MDSFEASLNSSQWWTMNDWAGGVAASDWGPADFLGDSDGLSDVSLRVGDGVVVLLHDAGNSCPSVKLESHGLVGGHESVEFVRELLVLD